MIGEKLQEMLDLRGISQSELARRTGASKTTINSIIKRNNKGMDFSLMEKIADVLEVPIEYFKENKEPIDGDGLNEKEKRFVSVFTALSPRNRHTVLVIAEALLRDQSENPDPSE